MQNTETQNSIHPSANRLPLVGVVICSILLVILYYPVLVLLVQDWIKLPDFSHGFLVPLVSLYLVWGKREDLATPPRPANWGLLLLVFGLALLFFGRLAAEYFTQRLSILVVIAGIVLFLLGRDHLRTVAFPLAFLVLMIPLPSILLQKLTGPMQFLASVCAANSLEMLGIPVLREGNIIHLSNTSLEVAEACSGIRSMISLFTLGVLFAYFTKKILWQRILLVLACLPITILVNAFRVSLTGVLAHYYGAAAAEGFFHEFSGYVLFMLAVVLFYGVSLLLSKLAPSQK
ncbi:MAG: exosortase A [Syntrophobacteraceae bacterium]